MLHPVLRWLNDAFAGGNQSKLLEAFQLQRRLDPPLDWRRGSGQALYDLLGRIEQDTELGLDLIDFALFHAHLVTPRYEHTNQFVAHLLGVLRFGGSAWEIEELGQDEPGHFRLVHRVVGPVRETILSVPASERAHQHLVASWNKLVGRNADESAAYREAVRAVEAAAKPVVLPDNARATLGTMIAAMRDKPEKWEVTLGSVDDVRGMMESVWTGQLDRHGTDDDSVPLNVSGQEADAAFATCLALVRLFSGGHVRRLG
jgi:hypothetical protein